MMRMMMRATAAGTALMALVLCAHPDVQPQKHFEPTKFAGKWYRVGLAYDSPGFVRYRERMRINMGALTLQANGNINLTMWSMGKTGCEPTAYMYEKTAVPGVFKYFSTRHNRIKDIMVLETNYNEYALVLKHKKMEKEFTQVALYGRSQKLRPELVEKFRQFSLSYGFSKESILTPPPEAADCPPA